MRLIQSKYSGTFTVYCKSLKMDHVMCVVIGTVNFIRARGLNHRQFNAFLLENDIHHGLPCHTDVRWLSRGTVLKHFYKLRRDGRVHAG